MTATIASSKTYTLDRLGPLLEAEKALGKRVVLCHGTFDTIHNGHLAHLREAKSHGDILVVGIEPSVTVPKGPGRPVFSDEQRLEHMAALEIVDYVVLGDAYQCINAARPHVIAKGADY